MPPKAQLVKTPSIGDQLRSLQKDWEQSEAEAKADRALKATLHVDKEVREELVSLSKDNYAQLRTSTAHGKQSYTILSKPGRSPECDNLKLWTEVLAPKTLHPLGLNAVYEPPRWGRVREFMDDQEPTQCRIDLTWPKPLPEFVAPEE